MIGPRRKIGRKFFFVNFYSRLYFLCSFFKVFPFGYCVLFILCSIFEFFLLLLDDAVNLTTIHEDREFVKKGLLLEV